MNWLNYHHLHYFWIVAQEGSIAAAGRRLHVGRPSISSQLKSLEASVGAPLFERRGRSLELTSTGHVVKSYADQIFQLGEELSSVVRGTVRGRLRPLRVGIADVMMKLVAFRLLEPLLYGGEVDGEIGPGDATRGLRCTEASPRALFASLAVHDLDLVLTDIPPSPDLDIRLYSTVVGESGVGLFAHATLAGSLAADFPRSLDGAKFLMPSRASHMRHGVEAWLEENELAPKIAGEFEDSALLKIFGEAGHGVFPAPLNVRTDLEKRYGVQCLGTLEGVVDRSYAVTPAAKHLDPAVGALLEQLSE